MKWTRIFHSVAFYLVILFLVLTVVQYFAGQTEAPAEYSYFQFLRLVDEGRVAQVDITFHQGGTGDASGVLTDETEFKTTVPTNDPELLEKLRQHEVEHEILHQDQGGWWMALLTSLLPVALVIGAFFFLMQRSQGGGSQVMKFGKSRAQKHTPEHKPGVTFDDVAGIEEVKTELEELTDFLREPRKYIQMGARIPKGVLLVGAPGTGKTLVARAVAGEAGVPFYSISGSDFVEMFVGVGASRVRDLFEQAKKNSPSIVFIDEIDAVGRQRGAGHGGGHDEREQTLNQLLTEMDGFEINEGVILIAATNRPDVLDPALLRPGRFDRQLTLGRPDLRGRKKIFEIHLDGKPLKGDVDVDVLARRTPGFTGADIENSVNEAALLAARHNKDEISMSDFEDAIDRIMAGGPEKDHLVISEKEKSIIAYHEAAHALVGDLLKNTDPVHKISIIPRGGALGYVLQMPMEDRYLVTKDEILDRVTMALAGRAAEDLIFNEISTGAQDDLEKSTKMVRQMITEYGMSEEMGPMTYGESNDNPFLGKELARGRNYSEEVASAIDREIRSVVANCYDRAMNILNENHDVLEKVAETLKYEETLESDDLQELLESCQDVDGTCSDECADDEQQSQTDDEPKKADDSSSGKSTVDDDEDDSEQISSWRELGPQWTNC